MSLCSTVCETNCETGAVASSSCFVPGTSLVIFDMINPLTPELIPPRNGASRDFLLGTLIFKGFTTRRLYKSFGVKELNML
jgi:hypothetical protein